jgi:hypothetical protein
MSEWLPYVGLAYFVVFKQHEKGNWYIEGNNGGKLNFEDPKLSKNSNRLIPAWGVNASVRRVDDFSFRYSLKYRIDIDKNYTGILASIPYLQVVLAKSASDLTFFSIKEGNNHYKQDKNLLLDLYTFGTRNKSSERTTVRQCNPLLPTHYEVESTGLQMVEQLVWRGVKVPIDSIIKNYISE